MNGKKAKALRRAIGFKPSAPRTYTGGLVQRRGLLGNRMSIVVTAVSEGKRRQYQAAKRRGMVNHILGGKHA